MTNTYGKPPKPSRCTVQLVDTTTNTRRHVCKLTVYADAATVERLIRTALEAAGLAAGGSQ